MSKNTTPENKDSETINFLIISRRVMKLEHRVEVAALQEALAQSRGQVNLRGMEIDTHRETITGLRAALSNARQALTDKGAEIYDLRAERDRLLRETTVTSNDKEQS